MSEPHDPDGCWRCQDVARAWHLKETPLPWWVLLAMLGVGVLAALGFIGVVIMAIWRVT